MPREGKKTVAKTSVADIVVKLMDAYIDKHSNKQIFLQKKISRSELITDMLLWYLLTKGELESLLKQYGYQDAEVEKIKKHLTEEHGVPPKAS